MLRYSWTCSCCGKQHDELPLHWGVDAPDFYVWLSDAEQKSRAELSDDFCTIDGQYFFVRGRIEIPIIGYSETFSWGAWASLSATSMETVRRVWDQPSRQSTGEFFGWLSTSLPHYPETLSLKTHVRLNAPPIISSIMLEPTDHPLAVEQREGIRLERAIEIAEALLPSH